MDKKKNKAKRAFAAGAPIPRRPKTRPGEGPRWKGILVKDYFPLINVLTVLGVIATVSVGYFNAQSQQHSAAIDADRKLVNERFVDVQNRLSKSDSVMERVNAASSLADIALWLDPSYAQARDDRDLADRLELPHAWVGKLYVGTTLRPNEHAYPYFKPAATRLASVVMLDPEKPVRDAAIKSISVLAKFAGKEVEGLDWPTIDKLPKDRSALPLSKWLAEALAESDRFTWNKYKTSFGELLGAARAFAYSPEQKLPSANDINGVVVREADSPFIAEAEIETLILPATAGKPTGDRIISENFLELRRLIRKLSGWLDNANGDYIQAVEATLSANDIVETERVCKRSPKSTWAQTWQAKQTQLKADAERFFSCRDALALLMGVPRVKIEQLPDDFVRATHGDYYSTYYGKTNGNDWRTATRTKTQEEDWRATLHSQSSSTSQARDLQARWNKGDRFQSLFGFNLSGVSLCYSTRGKVNLIGCDLSDVNLTGALFSASIIVDCNLFDVIGSDAWFDHSYCPQSNFYYAFLPGSNFSDSVLSRSSFEQAILYQAKLVDSVLDDTNFVQSRVKWMSVSKGMEGLFPECEKRAGDVFYVGGNGWLADSRFDVNTQKMIVESSSTPKR